MSGGVICVENGVCAHMCMGIHEYNVSGRIYKKLVTVVATDEGGGLFLLFLKILPGIYMPCHSSTHLNDHDKASLQFWLFFPSPSWFTFLSEDLLFVNETLFISFVLFINIGKCRMSYFKE